MRLTIVNSSRRKIGGAEQNLDVVLPEFERRGHQLQFLYFHDEPADRAAVRTGPATELVHVPVLGEAQSLDRVRAFRPAVIHVHGDIDPAFQSALLRIAPCVYSVHNYYGVCISGLKTTQFPMIQPCARTFGPACLARYFPRRCGGFSPVTMLRRYRTERDRLAVLSRYDAVITHSRHMEDEYRRHGIRPERIHGLPYEAAGGHERAAAPPPDLLETARLLFVGRMEKLKGGRTLLRALPRVQSALARPIRLDLAGDGPERQSWQRLAAALTLLHPAITVHFHGWRARRDLHQLFRETHLLVLPSLWPEPFGKVGPEAFAFSVPVAAFDVGGIGEWLVPGLNGMMAPGDPPTAAGLAAAIADCLADPAFYQQLCAGAAASAARFHLLAHVDNLLELFERVCRERSSRPELSVA